MPEENIPKAKMPRHEITVMKLRTLQKTHQHAVNQAQRLIYQAHLDRLESVLELAVDEAFGRLGISDLIEERQELLKKLARIDRKISNQTGGIMIAQDAKRVAQDATKFINISLGPLARMPASLREEVEAICIERGWGDLLQVPPYEKAVITLDELRAKTTTLAEVQKLLGEEQRQIMSQLLLLSPKAEGNVSD